MDRARVAPPERQTLPEIERLATCYWALSLGGCPEQLLCFPESILQRRLDWRDLTWEKPQMNRVRNNNSVLRWWQHYPFLR